jgi:hypothetical protein
MTLYPSLYKQLHMRNTNLQKETTHERAHQHQQLVPRCCCVRDETVARCATLSVDESSLMFMWIPCIQTDNSWRHTDDKSMSWVSSTQRLVQLFCCSYDLASVSYSTQAFAETGRVCGMRSHRIPAVRVFTVGGANSCVIWDRRWPAIVCWFNVLSFLLSLVCGPVLFWPWTA